MKRAQQVRHFPNQIPFCADQLSVTLMRKRCEEDVPAIQLCVWSRLCRTYGARFILAPY
jgi:hypothetical protein